MSGSKKSRGSLRTELISKCCFFSGLLHWKRMCDLRNKTINQLWTNINIDFVQFEVNRHNYTLGRLNLYLVKGFLYYVSVDDIRCLVSYRNSRKGWFTRPSLHTLIKNLTKRKDIYFLGLKKSFWACRMAFPYLPVEVAIPMLFMWDYYFFLYEIPKYIAPNVTKKCKTDIRMPSRRHFFLQLNTYCPNNGLL